MKKNYKNKEQKDKNLLPARVHILLAKESTKALIIRRFPSYKMCTILWDRKDNTFKSGECVHRIEERMSDISPDGEYFYYHASMKYGSWEAISKIPNIRAMLLYRYTSFRSRDRFSTPKPHILKQYKYFTQINPYSYNDPNLGYPRFKTKKLKKESWDICGITARYYRRLLRDGWSIVGHFGGDTGKYSCSYRTLFEKSIVGNFILQKSAFDVHPAPEGKNGGHWDEHTIVNIKSKVEKKFSLWDWADVANGYLYWTEKGILYSLCISHIVSNGVDLKKAEVLCDLNTFSVTYKKNYFSIDGDVSFQHARILEENYKPNEEIVEKLYLESIDNGGIDACFYLAELYEKQKKSSTTVEKYIKMGFDRAKKENNLLFWHYEKYGDILYDNAKYNDALEIFTESLQYSKEDKNLAVAYNYIGVIYKKNKNLKKALVYMEKAFKLNDLEIYKNNIKVVKQECLVRKDKN